MLVHSTYKPLQFQLAEKLVAVLFPPQPSFSPYQRKNYNYSSVPQLLVGAVLCRGHT